jgi:predicted nuclease with RNAse H fold
MMRMRTVGVDLAAEPAKTATAVIDWSRRGATVAVTLGQTDDDIIASVGDADKVGLDCPVGWPDAFVDFLAAQREGRRLPPTDLAGRRLLAYRETDRAVTALTGLRPLSVSADRIGHGAMRAVGLLSRLGAAGHDVRRDGRGLVVESYPAAALKQWGFPHRSYKGRDQTAALGTLVDALDAGLPGLELGAAGGLCRQSDDAFDAVICALIARAASLGLVHPPTAKQLKVASTEGWIVVPLCVLPDLLAD